MSGNVARESLVPLIFGNLLCVPNMQDSCIVQQKIQSAKAAHGLVEQATNFARFGNVGWNGKRKIANLLSNLFNAVPSPSDQRHPRPFPRQGYCASASNSTARTSDDSNLAFQTFTHDQ
jgi:hypothetical protein